MCLIQILYHDWVSVCVCVYLFRSDRTELAVLASSPVVGSSRKRTDGSIISSMPMLVLFLSPPEMPRISCVPTCQTANQRATGNQCPTPLTRNKINKINA